MQFTMQVFAKKVEEKNGQWNDQPLWVREQELRTTQTSASFIESILVSLSIKENLSPQGASKRKLSLLFFLHVLFFYVCTAWWIVVKHYTWAVVCLFSRVSFFPSSLYSLSYCSCHQSSRGLDGNHKNCITYIHTLFSSNPVFLYIWKTQFFLQNSESGQSWGMYVSN